MHCAAGWRSGATHRRPQPAVFPYICPAGRCTCVHSALWRPADSGAISHSAPLSLQPQPLPRPAPACLRLNTAAHRRLRHRRSTHTKATYPLPLHFPKSLSDMRTHGARASIRHRLHPEDAVRLEFDVVAVGIK